MGRGEGRVFVVAFPRVLVFFGVSGCFWGYLAAEGDEYLDLVFGVEPDLLRLSVLAVGGFNVFCRCPSQSLVVGYEGGCRGDGGVDV